MLEKIEVLTEHDLNTKIHERIYRSSAGITLTYRKIEGAVASQVCQDIRVHTPRAMENIDQREKKSDGVKNHNTDPRI